MLRERLLDKAVRWLLKEIRALSPDAVAHDARARKLASAAAKAANARRLASRAARAANFIEPSPVDDDRQHLEWMLGGMSIAKARGYYTPGPMRGGKPDMRAWQFGVHAHPALWDDNLLLSDPHIFLPQPKQVPRHLDHILIDFKLRNQARSAICTAMGESTLDDEGSFRTHDEWCGEMAKLTEGDLLRQPNFGRVSLNIVKEYLRPRGLILAPVPER